MTAANNDSAVMSPGAEWPNRLYDQKGVHLMYPYVKPGQTMTKEEHNLNLGAHTGRLEYMENIVPGGRQSTYVMYPQVHIGNWWERCCQEKPGFLISLVSAYTQRL